MSMPDASSRANEKARETMLKERELQDNVEEEPGQKENIPKSVVEEKKRYEANKEKEER